MLCKGLYVEKKGIDQRTGRGGKVPANISQIQSLSIENVLKWLFLVCEHHNVANTNCIMESITTVPMANTSVAIIHKQFSEICST